MCGGGSEGSPPTQLAAGLSAGRSTPRRFYTALTPRRSRTARNVSPCIKLGTLAFAACIKGPKELDARVLNGALLLLTLASSTVTRLLVWSDPA